MMMKHESEHYESEPKHIEKDLFKKAVITKVIELQRAIIRELLGV
jgi:hypothetical protein